MILIVSPRTKRPRKRSIMASRILRLKATMTLTGLSRSTIYLRIAQDSFPKPLSLGARAVGWLESDIEALITNLQAKL